VGIERRSPSWRATGRLFADLRGLVRDAVRPATVGLTRTLPSRPALAASLAWGPGALAAGYDVVVVGSGVTAASCAWSLIRSRRWKVALVSPTWLDVEAETPVLFHPLRDEPAQRLAVERSAALFSLLAEGDRALQAHRSPVLRLALDTAAASEGPRHAVLLGASLLAGPAAGALVPALRPGVVRSALLAERVRVVEADGLAGRFAAQAVALGAAVVEDCPVRSLDRQGDGFRLVTDRGETRAGIVLDATADAAALRAAGLGHGSVWAHRLRVYTEPVEPVLDAHLLTPGVSVSQLRSGEVVLTGPRRDLYEPGAEVDLPAAAEIAASAVRLVPALAELSAVAVATTCWLEALDGRPLVGPTGRHGLYRASGVDHDAAVAAAVGEAAAAMICGDEPSLPLHTWAAARADASDADPPGLAPSGLGPRSPGSTVGLGPRSPGSTVGLGPRSPGSTVGLGPRSPGSTVGLA